MGELVRITLGEHTEEERLMPATKKKADDFMVRPKTEFKTVVAAEAILRVNQLEDLRFRASEQWDERSIADRNVDGRPCLTINRLPQFIRQVTNAQRNANLAVQVSPVDDKADIKTAEVFQGIIRHIEDQSDAAVAYSTAGDNQATIGRGYIRVIAEYRDDRSFTQDLKIKRVRNPFTVYLDPAIQEADGSDARFAFIVEDVPSGEYIARFGEDSMASLTDFTSVGDQDSSDWMPEGKVRIAEYWYVDLVKTKILLVQWPDSIDPGTGQTVPGDQEVMTQAEFDKIPEMLRKGGTTESGTIIPPLKIVADRMVDERHVKMALINGAGIIEGNEDKTEGKAWPGQWIPLVQVIGDEIDINGIVDYRGMVRDAKDPQRLYNFQNTSLAETLSLAPLSQWVGYFGQFEGHEEKWNQANRRRFPYLEVNPMTAEGKVVPLPQRITAEPAIQAIVASIRQSDNDLQATTGLYQESLGKRSSSQQSGKAISALQKQGEIANSNFLDNMARAIRSIGRILVDLIPHYYDAPQVIRILGFDDQEKTVMVHGGADADDLPDKDHLPEGVSGLFDLSAGRYDVTVAAGPSKASQRQEAAEALTNLVAANPAMFPIIGDLMVQNMDWPGSQAAAARLKKLVPPEARDDDPNKPSIPPEVQQQVAQMTQQMQEMGQKLDEAQRALAGKEVEGQYKVEEAKIEAASRIRIEEIRASVETDVVAQKLDVQKAQAYTDALEARFAKRLDLVMAQLDHAHARGIQAMEHAHDAQQADADQTHQAQMGAVDKAHEVATGAVAHRRATDLKGQDQAHQRALSAEQDARAAQQAEIQAQQAPEPSKE